MKISRFHTQSLSARSGRHLKYLCSSLLWLPWLHPGCLFSEQPALPWLASFSDQPGMPMLSAPHTTSFPVANDCMTDFHAYLQSSHSHEVQTKAPAMGPAWPTGTQVQHVEDGKLCLSPQTFPPLLPLPPGVRVRNQTSCCSFLLPAPAPHALVPISFCNPPLFLNILRP